ncbi:MAG: ubiquinone biosynthesis protein [Methylococcaceae bacterium]|nr:ubiquinone biosynthesis protein [Methylococcaceae bacterium]
MVSLLDTIIVFPVVIYTVPLGICLVFWLFSLLGIFDVDIFDIDLDLDTDAEVSGLLATFGFAGVPITLSLSILFFFAWTLALLASTWLLPLLNLTGQAVLFIAGCIVLIVSFIIAVIFTGKITRPLSKLFVTHEAKSNASLVSKTCVISSLKVNETFGQAKLEDGGAGLIISVRADTPNRLKKGDTALIYEYDSDKNLYFILKED